jgi:hypothetical protein
MVALMTAPFRLHARTKISLWCTGFGVALNGIIGLMMAARALHFPAVAYLNVYFTPLLALAPVCLLPSSIWAHFRPGPTAAAHIFRPRIPDLLLQALCFVLTVGCVLWMVHMVDVAEHPMWQRLRDTWSPDPFYNP